MSKVVIERKLDILPNNTLIVPGCEPASATSSITLMINMRRAGICKNAVVSLQAALDAIPGSRVEIGTNFNVPRKRWLVLPPFDPEACPCVGEPDWYGVLQSLAQEDAPVVEKFDQCNIIGMGYCPSPDFKDTRKPGPHGKAPDGGDPVSTYFKEGSNEVFEHYTV